MLTPFGFHIIRVDEHKGDSITVRHILVKIAQSDSSAAQTDRRADSLSKAANLDKPAEFDSVAKMLGLKVGHSTATESDPLTWDGRYVPGGSAWAFGGAKAGETSDLIDSDDAYYLVRLDTLHVGGKPTFEAAKEDIRRELVRQKRLDLLMPKAQGLVTAVRGGQTLEAAAQTAGLKVEKSHLRAGDAGAGARADDRGDRRGIRRTGGLGRAAGEGANNVIVLRVDKRTDADKAAFEKQKKEQRDQMIQRVRQQRVQQYLAALRDAANVEDNRRIVKANARQATS